MTFSIRATIRECVVPEHRLSCSSRLWRNLLYELARRGGGSRESGAFLLGRHIGKRRVINKFVCYDDLDLHSLDSGIVVFDGAGYGPLWQQCRQMKMEVVADVHTHGGAARQSVDDRNNPMIATVGHIALIVPRFAQRPVRASELGVYEYQGNHCWQSYSGRTVENSSILGYRDKNHERTTRRRCSTSYYQTCNGYRRGRNHRGCRATVRWLSPPP